MAAASLYPSINTAATSSVGVASSPSSNGTDAKYPDRRVFARSAVINAVRHYASLMVMHCMSTITRVYVCMLRVMSL
jgi:hypothetical protein